MLLRISYSQNGQQIVKQHQVSLPLANLLWYFYRLALLTLTIFASLTLVLGRPIPFVLAFLVLSLFSLCTPTMTPIKIVCIKCICDSDKNIKC